MRYYWEHLLEHIWNMDKTLWEFDEDTLGTAKPRENSFHYSKGYGMTKLTQG